MRKNNKGITLIALVVTIVVILIIAGVSIMTLVGDNGIINHTIESKIKNESAAEQEKMMLIATAAKIEGQGRIKYIDLVTELNKEFKDTEYEIVEGDQNTIEWTIKVNRTSSAYKITQAGATEKVNYIDWEEIFANATKHKDQSSTNNDIGIDMYGNIVNMDWWECTENTSDNTFRLGIDRGSKTTSAYLGQIVEGKIVGEIPKYLKRNGEWYLLTSMNSSFQGQEGLVIAPTIPDSVTVMTCTFNGCQDLQQAPVIPESVATMDLAFQGCHALTGVLEVNASLDLTNYPYAYDECLFWAATDEGTNLVVIGTSAYLDQIVQATILNMSHVTKGI